MSITDLLKEKVEKQLNALSEQLEAARLMPKQKKPLLTPMPLVPSCRRSCWARSTI